MDRRDPEATERRQEIARRAGVVASDRLSDLWWMFAVRGVLALGLGTLALFWPTGSVSALLRLAGLFLVLDGAISLFGRRREDVGGGIAAGELVSIVVGLALLLLPNATARLAFVLLGLWALLTGASYLLAWWSLPPADPERGTVRTVGIVAALAGLALLFWPGVGVVAIGWMIALVAFGIAAVLLFMASRLRRLNGRIQTRL